jgi:Uma2 family endonuclease
MFEGWKTNPVAVADYLKAEACAETRHEYVAGAVYAMAGASNAHNQIATNILVAFSNRLRGRPCRPFNSDTRIRLRLQSQQRFYYPDVSVTCRPNPQSDSYQDEPAVVVEVMSPETRRIDENEKYLAYTALPSLSVYLLVAQDTADVVVFRRFEQGFVRQVYASLEAVIPLPEIGCELPLAEAYEGVELADA